jgi:hypothetical protein
MTEDELKAADEKRMNEDFEEALKIAKENFEDLEERFGKDAYGSFELADRSWILYENFQSYILGHPTLSLDKKLFEKAWKVKEVLADFYQEIACWGVDWDDVTEEAESVVESNESIEEEENKQ